MWTKTQVTVVVTDPDRLLMSDSWFIDSLVDVITERLTLRGLTYNIHTLLTDSLTCAFSADSSCHFEARKKGQHGVIVVSVLALQQVGRWFDLRW